jgi:hypothetical protein
MKKQKQITRKKTKKTEDTYSYRGWLNSDSFLKRAFSIFGYAIVANLIIYIPFAIIGFLVVVIMMMALGAGNSM